jgi:D-alanyl-D-alanine dipeptidase
MNAQVYPGRMARAAAEAAARGAEAMVVTPSPDLAYLTGYTPMPLERPTLLVLRPGRDPALLVPELERPLAAASPAGPALELIPWSDGQDPYEEAARLLPASGRVAVCDRMWSAHLLGIQAALPGAVFDGAGRIMGALRAVKGPEELDALRRAATAADGCFEQILGVTFSGLTEAAVAALLADLLLASGHSRADFTIVASGPNSASPHHEPHDRVISPGDAVVLDFGGELDGYFSDTTRTVVVGEPPPDLERVYAIVRDAQEAATAMVRPGVRAEEVDRTARAIIAEAGFGERFIHRTGHGIGLEVHERPYIVEGDGTELKPGMTFSVEPGIYLDARFGVRIEDIVAVTEEGVERLNRSTHDLQVVA